MFHGRAEEHRKAKKEDPDAHKTLRDIVGRKCIPRAELYSHTTEEQLDSWLAKKCEEYPKLATNTAQKAFLEAVVERVKTERREEADPEIRKQRYTTTEPMLDLLHGLPGTGKSSVFAMLRDLFDNVLQWEHDVQYVVLAFQNAMARCV